MQENNTDDSLKELSNNLQQWLAGYFSTKREAIKEYELIALVDKQGFFDNFKDESLNLVLFKKHFLLMNALYSLRKALLTKSQWLAISALEIQVSSLACEADSTELSTSDTYLDDYYLDWSFFHEASEGSVSELLTSFWQAYSANDKSADALKYFGFDSMPSEQGLKDKYRSMANEFHPDKGGDATQFVRLREYYLCLKKLL